MSTVLDRVLGPLTDCFTPEVASRIVGLKLDPVVQSRLDELAEKANEGLLTQEERAEYEQYVDSIDFVAILKAQARRAIARQAG
jgi:hypothetical protein